MNSRPAKAYQVRDGGEGLKQKLLQIESAIKIFNHKTSVINVAPVIHAFRKISKHTSYIPITNSTERKEIRTVTVASLGEDVSK